MAVIFKATLFALILFTFQIYIKEFLKISRGIDFNLPQLNYFWLTLVIFFISISYIFNTLIFRSILNGLNKKNHSFSFLEAVGIYNSSQLAKYTPGKIWGYLLQCKLLIPFGISKYKVAYVNLLIIYYSILYSILLGFFAISFFLGLDKFNLIFINLGVIFSFFYFRLHSFLFITIKKVLNYFGKSFYKYKINKKELFKINLYSFVAVFFFGISASSSLMTIGIQPDFKLFTFIFGAMIISDLIGFLAFLVPAGIGIREFLLFKMLSSISTNNFLIFIPLILRMANMLSDLLLGALGFFILYLKRK
jgi:hypothetical protein